MKLIELPLLADENIDPIVINYFRSQGFDTQSVIENSWAGLDDERILEHAFRLSRVIVTHDSDFGKLTIPEGKPFTGIIYLKPGHIDPSFTLLSIEVLLDKVEAVQPPFIIVVQHGRGGIRIRYRQKQNSNL
jgi:predicted nuclease of predicted toxin-antitoxin system